MPRLKELLSRPPQNPPHPQKPTKTPATVLLTGSTGSLGAYLLNSLLASPAVAHIICLNRSDDAETRQRRSHDSKGLASRFPPERVQFLTCDLSAADLGLPADIYAYLQKGVTHICHNAWRVDFNLAFESFAPHVTGVRNLIDFAHGCRFDCYLFFISSISVAANWGRLPGSAANVPEAELEDWRLARMGYGQSKLVSERLLSDAAQACGLRTATCRVGQVAGPVLRGQVGVWKREEWLPSLVASSEFLKMVPATLGPVDGVEWVPVDLLAQVVVDLLIPVRMPSRKDSRKSEMAVYHAVNPSTVSWSEILPTVLAYLGEDIKVVSLPEWVATLKKSTLGTDANPATKLIDFYDNLGEKMVRFPKTPAPTFDTKKTLQQSGTLIKLLSVNPLWMDLWMRQWGFSLPEASWNVENLRRIES